MILRVFRARVRPGKQADFRQLVQEQSIPWLKAQPGMSRYLPGAPLMRDDREFVMVTVWKDLDALRAFVGENWQTPVLTADERPLVEQMTAEHYEYFDGP